VPLIARRRLPGIRGAIRAFAALIVTAVFAIPLYLALINTFKTNPQIVSSPAALPTPFTLGHIISVLNGSTYGFWNGLVNSIIIVVPSLAGAVILGAMAGYYLGRSTGITGRLLLGILLIGLMLPLQVILVPVSMILGLLGLQASFLGIILFNIALYVPFAAFIFSGFVKTVPLELEEAAELDGASRLRIFFQVVVPLLRPATASVLIFVSVWIWNDFLNPLILLGPGRGTTATTGIYLSLGQFNTDYGNMFAVMLLSALPILVFFFILQKQFVAGLTGGSIKG
jgi:raffinose/stachyose/melibiose transport system permease protein